VAAGFAWAGSNEAGLALVALGLGIQNVLTLPFGGVVLGRTFLSGSLVQFGQALAASLRGSGSITTAIVVLTAWVSFMLGVVAGNLLTSTNLSAILLGVAFKIGALALWALHMPTLAGRPLLRTSPTTQDPAP